MNRINPLFYYLLAAPIHWWSQGRLLALRLFSVMLGGGVVLLIFLCGARSSTRTASHCFGGGRICRPFLPMHVALMASVNNDALAELLIAGTVLALLRWQRLKTESEVDRREGPLTGSRDPHWAWLSHKGDRLIFSSLSHLSSSSFIQFGRVRPVRVRLEH